jgi:hypothetical protein
LQDELYALSLQSQPSLWVEPASDSLSCSQETSTESGSASGKARKRSGSEALHPRGRHAGFSGSDVDTADTLSHTGSQSRSRGGSVPSQRSDQDDAAHSESEGSRGAAPPDTAETSSECPPGEYRTTIAGVVVSSATASAVTISNSARANRHSKEVRVLKKEGSKDDSAVVLMGKLTPRMDAQTGRVRNLVNEFSALSDGSSSVGRSPAPREMINKNARLFQSSDDMRHDIKASGGGGGVDDILAKVRRSNRSSQDDNAITVVHRKHSSSKKKSSKDKTKSRSSIVGSDGSNLISGKKDESGGGGGGTSGRKLLGASLRRFAFTATATSTPVVANDAFVLKKSPRDVITPRGGSTVSRKLSDGATPVSSSASASGGSGVEDRLGLPAAAASVAQPSLASPSRRLYAVEQRKAERAVQQYYAEGSQVRHVPSSRSGE